MCDFVLHCKLCKTYSCYSSDRSIEKMKILVEEMRIVPQSYLSYPTSLN